MKFYSEKLSPRRLSLQWRLTLLISGLVITACALMYFFISRSAVTGLEGISDYVVLVTPDNSNPISINVDPKILIPDLENQIQNTKNNFLFQSMIATGIIILLSSICTWFVTRRALTPLRRFSDRIRQVQAQNLSEPLEVPLSEDEISRLTRSFNDMLARLDNAFSAQKQFVASAAHELRTPLAVMQTNLEVFYKKPEHAPQEYDRLFTMLQEQTGRLSHLAEILLDMTGLQTVERSDTISLAALTEEVFCDLDPVAEKHQVRLIQTDGDCTVTGSYILLYRAVYNLVENAIKYNRPSGSVTVSIHSAESAVLEVTDTGIGISPENQEKIFALQDKLYADAKEGLIIILQARDAAGKDSTIRHVMGGINPQGVQVFSYKQPSKDELAHDYLWRCVTNLPKRGMIAIFNRSYYEDVLVVKVHELYKGYHMAKRCLNPDTIIENRYRQIRHFEEYLYDNSYRVVKILLNVSKEKQKQRFLERIDLPEKNWKFSQSDMAERALWDQYDDAYERAVNATATKENPWYVIPADQKWYSRYLVSEIILDVLQKIDPQYPTLSQEEAEKLPQYKEMLQNENMKHS